MTPSEVVGLVVGGVLLLIALAGLWLAWYAPPPQPPTDDQEGGDLAC